MSILDLVRRIFHPQPVQTPSETTPLSQKTVLKELAQQLPLSELLPFPYREISATDSSELLALWQSSHRDGIAPLLVAADEQFMEMICENTWEYDELPDLNELYEIAKSDLKIDEFSHFIIGNPDAVGEAMNSLYCPAMDDGSPFLLAEIPAEHPWDIFRLLPIGGWNDCPDASFIAAFCKEMHECYGVRPVLVSGDMLIVKPERLPTKEEAYDLALKLYAFCPDMVMQGLGSLHALADSLTKSPLWQFWWD